MYLLKKVCLHHVTRSLKASQALSTPSPRHGEQGAERPALLAPAINRSTRLFMSIPGCLPPGGDPQGLQNHSLWRIEL